MGLDTLVDLVDMGVGSGTFNSAATLEANFWRLSSRSEPGESYGRVAAPAQRDPTHQVVRVMDRTGFDPVFDDGRFEYRRGRSTKDALGKVWK